MFYLTLRWIFHIFGAFKGNGNLKTFSVVFYSLRNFAGSQSVLSGILLLLNNGSHHNGGTVLHAGMLL